MVLMREIAAGDTAGVLQKLTASPALANECLKEGATRQNPNKFYLEEIRHYLYAGDSAVHTAAAAYRYKIARKLIALGADVRAQNRRGAEPLHYAVVGIPGSPTW